MAGHTPLTVTADDIRTSGAEEGQYDRNTFFDPNIAL
jgi:hypothetical protein